jgi:hypothetical protein
MLRPTEYLISFSCLWNSIFVGCVRNGTCNVVEVVWKRELLLMQVMLYLTSVEEDIKCI